MVVVGLGGVLSGNKNVSSDMGQPPLPKTVRPSAWLPESVTDGPLSVAFTDGVARPWMLVCSGT